MSERENKGGGKLWGGVSGAKKTAPEPNAFAAAVAPYRAPEASDSETYYQPEDDAPPYVPDDPDDRRYKAFRTHRQAQRLQIRTVGEGTFYPAYHYLSNMHFEHDFGTAFTLMFGLMRVDVTGQNLGEIVHAIEWHRCISIRQWHSKFYDRPAKGEPFIEGIKVIHLGQEEDDEPK